MSSSLPIPIDPAAATVDARRTRRLAGAFAREQQAGLRLATVARLWAMAAAAAVLLLTQPIRPVIFYLGAVALFAALGALQYGLSRVGWLRRWHPYAFVAADAILLTCTLLVPNPLDPDVLPPAMALRFGTFIWFFVLLVPVALSYAPALVMWTGVSMAASWLAGVIWVVSQPETLSEFNFRSSDPSRMTLAERLAIYHDPRFVDLGQHVTEALVLVIVAAILAVAVARARALVRSQAIAERERGNLARYFSPNMVDSLADRDEALRGVRRQDVAVLFADIIGFTRYAAGETPERVIAMLREHYARLEEVVFAHGGTIDKYIGDALMATFGTPLPGERDATRALRCALAMLGALDQWNRERAARGEPPVRIGIGLHYGPAVLGDIGGERRLEFAVIGDTVNVASRFEALTRELDTRLVVGEPLVAAIRLENGGAGAIELRHLVEGPATELRGRDEPVKVWTFG